MSVLVTGAAGFIGYHVALRLLAAGETVVGLDNFSPYYDVRLKESRVARLVQEPRFVLLRGDITDRAALNNLFLAHQPRRVVHLAAQAGVRHSLSHPQVYVESNLAGFVNILEACREHAVEHLVYASTSSVYGANAEMPFHERQPVQHPLSLYAATKAANELLAHAYTATHGLKATGLRFFTVYGPWGRPDMALFLFTRAILAGAPIRVFNHGQMQRDFTYIDDIVSGVVGVLGHNPEKQEGPPQPGSSPVGAHRIYNIGNMQPVNLMDYISFIEEKLGREAIKEFLPMQVGDVAATYADCSALHALTGYQPTVDARTGVGRFVEWYLEHYAA